MKKICVCWLLFCGVLTPRANGQQKSFIDRTLDKAYRIVQGDSAHPHRRYFFPVPIVAFRPETRWVLGVSLTHLFRPRHIDSITRPSAVRLNVSYTQNNQFSVRTMLDIFTKENRWNLRGHAQYTDFAEFYWGRGIDAPASAKELYHFKATRFSARAGYRIQKGLYVGPLFNYENLFDVSYDNPTGPMATSKDASTRGYKASGLGLTVYLDNRDNIFYPLRGNLVEIAWTEYLDGFLGNGPRFRAASLDARKYIALWNRNVLALQLVTYHNPGSGVPFRMMGTLGSDSYMRGYYSGRYRDNYSFAYQGELRKTIWKPFSMVIFGGFGTVSSDASGLLSNLKPNYGVGARVMAIPREKMNIRVDYGMGADGNAALYITMGEAF